MVVRPASRAAVCFAGSFASARFSGEYVPAFVVTLHAERRQRLDGDGDVIGRGVLRCVDYEARPVVVGLGRLQHLPQILGLDAGRLILEVESPRVLLVRSRRFAEGERQAQWRGLLRSVPGARGQEDQDDDQRDP